MGVVRNVQYVTFKLYQIFFKSWIYRQMRVSMHNIRTLKLVLLNGMQP